MFKKCNFMNKSWNKGRLEGVLFDLLKDKIKKD